MIGIGINENVVLEKVELNEKEGKLSIDFAFRSVGAGPTPAENPLDFLDEEYDENGMLVTAKGKSNVIIKLWPLTPPKDKDMQGNPKTISARIQESNDAGKEMQNLFTSLARVLVTSDQIRFERFQGVPITNDSLQLLLDENVLLQITRNLATQFIAMCGSAFNRDEMAMRILFRRQSPAKPYPAFRDRMLQMFPFVESMAIPKESSKLAFTKYEISKGLHLSTPVPGTDAPPTEQAPTEPNTLFGSAPAAGELPSFRGQ